MVNNSSQGEHSTGVTSDGASIRDNQHYEPAADLYIVRTEGLKTLELRPGVLEYIRQIRSRWDYIVEDSKAKAFRTQRSYRFWKVWLIVLPMLDAALYGFLFGFLLQTSRGIENFVGYLILGLTYFSFMSRLLKAGSGLVVTNRNLIRAFAFPRAAIVISQSLRYFWDALPAAIVAVLATLVLQWDQPLSWTLVFIVPIYILMFMFGTGLMFLTARLTAFTPDFKVLIDLFSRAWMFSSGIFYSIERFAHRPIIYEVMSWNPAHRFLECVREIIIQGTAPSIVDFGILASWSFGTFLVGFLVFWQSEGKYVWA